MYSYIKGKVAHISESKVVIENNGIGYELLVSSGCASTLMVGQDAKIYTYLYVREDIMNLYGFVSEIEKNLFLRLISVSGVGAKVGLSILSGSTIASLTSAVASGNIVSLSNIKGIGKKTAERIVLELKDKIKKDFAGEITESDIPKEQDNDSNLSDGVLALMSLGYSKKDALDSIKAVDPTGKTLEEIIILALRK